MKNNHSLTDSLQLAPSELFVADLQLMTNYYRDIVGLFVLSSTKTSTILGHGQVPVITLLSQPKLAHASPRSAGLFHNAIVFGSRGDLAQAVGNTIMHSPAGFVGTGDHLVSEAFYFNDPEQNGLELYFDRPRDTWQWNNGHVVMDTLYIDPMDYINTHASSAGGSDKKLGHVHLKVGDITKARLFYVDMLGFDITAMMPGALFVSIAGYHHHLGLNTWQSSGAGMRSPTLGLSDVTIALANDADVARLAVRLEQAAYPFAYKNGIVHVSDPWGNSLIINSIN